MIQINMNLPKVCFDCPCAYLVMYGEHAGKDICNIMNYKGMDPSRCTVDLTKRPDWCPMTEPEWIPYDPMEGDERLEDHYYYLVSVKGKGTAMKAMYHCDKPFGFEPVNGDFDPFDVTGWMRLPNGMDKVEDWK